MSYTVEKTAGEPVILIRMKSDFDSITEAEPVLEEADALLAQQTQSTYFIWDGRERQYDLDQLMAGANVVRFRYKPPNFAETMTISSRATSKLAMGDMNSDVFDHLVMPVFANLDEALTYIHEQVKGQIKHGTGEPVQGDCMERLRDEL